jgi:hypothetical protein
VTGTYFQAQLSVLVFVTTERCATWDIDARASPRNPYVVRRVKSEKVDNLDVVNRSAKIGRSLFYEGKKYNYKDQAADTKH